MKIELKEFADSYFVSPEGEVFRKLKLDTTPRGYKVITVKSKRVFIHRKVAEQYIENKNNLPIVRHLDNNTGNNSKDNLAWGTYSDNEQDKRYHGTYYTRATKAKLSEDDVREIRRLREEENLKTTELAKRYDVDRGTINNIISGRTWKHVSKRI